MAVGDGVLRVRSGPSPASSPTTVACDAGDVHRAALGHENPSAATEAGRLTVDGDVEAVGHLFGAFAEAARRHTVVQSAPLTA